MALGQKSSGAVASTIAALLLLLPALVAYSYAWNVLPILGSPQVPLLSRPGPAAGANEQTFRLRHIIHQGGRRYPGLTRRLDVATSDQIMMESKNDEGYSPAPESYVTRSRNMRIQRLADRSHERIHTLLDAGRERGQPLELPASDWTIDNVQGPNVTDKTTLLSLAHMAADAYVKDNASSGWYDVGPGFNHTQHFGWEEDGLRGHIFVDETNETAVVAIKGTSLSLFLDPGGTSSRDKENDNLFFSCCCGQESFSYTHVCDCQTGSYACNSTCLTESLRRKNAYYYSGLNLYDYVSLVYPRANIWMIGHSLGGAVSSLVGATHGRPVVTFESPGEAMAAKRLGLPIPPGYRAGGNEPEYGNGAYHFGHNADPLFLGTCDYAVCYILGHAMQSVCHTGYECVYNTTGDKGWGPALQWHKIVTVIEDVINWYDEPAKCKVVENCRDCYKWKYKASNHSDKTTTSSKSRYTQTRTEMCKTPGWWGCLDESSTTTTTQISTTTCHSYDWFGRCKDPVTTTAEPTTTASIVTNTTTCETPGWFGCNDATPTATDGTSPTHKLTESPSHHRATSSVSSTTSCKDPGFFWGCWDKPTPGASVTSTTPLATSHHQSL